jgi:hypothetical protein
LGLGNVFWPIFHLYGLEHLALAQHSFENFSKTPRGSLIILH